MSARLACATSLPALIAHVLAFGVAGYLASLLWNTPTSVSVGLLAVGFSIYWTMRVSIALENGVLRVENRLSSHDIPVEDIEDLNSKSLDRDPQSPPCLRLKVSGRSREIQLEASAASSQEVREDIAERFTRLGLKTGPARRYIEW